MNALRWLHKNSFIVHMIVMMLTFYGAPILVSAVFYPHFIQPLTSAMLSGLILLSMGIASFKVGVIATDTITAALDRAVLRDLASRPEKPSIIAPVIDYGSPNTLVIDENVSSLGAAVTELQSVNLTDAPAVVSSDSTETVVAPKKKRGPRVKTSKKEA
jgi:hypothetical protein